MTGWRSAGFYARLFLFLVGPMLFRYMPVNAALLLVAMLALLTTVELIFGKTVWLPARPVNLGFILLYIILAAIILVWTSHFSFPVLLCLTLLIFSLGSDIIADSTRHWILMAAGFLLVWPCRHLAQLMPQLQYLEYYWPIPVIAAFARANIPKAEDLLHTSLDYPFFRLEILSIGMKKLVAIGLKKP